jgi:hypothetical protein
MLPVVLSVLSFPPAARTAAVTRRALLQGGAVAAVTASSPAARAEVPFRQPYCVPGVTAERCRGTFWESGQLYRKQDAGSSEPPSPSEYKQLKVSLEAIRAELGREGGEATAAEAGSAAYGARIKVRQLGAQLCRGLEEGERYDSERRLNSLIAALGDADSAALKLGDSKSVPAGFTTLGLLLDTSLKRFDDFLANLPASPTALD